MNRKSSLVVALASAAVLAVGFTSSSGAAPTSSSRADQTISVVRVGLTLPASSLDPVRTTLAALYWQVNLGLEGLMKLDANGRVVPHLAVSVKQPKPLRYEYTLRKGVKFWNGNELTAADVVNSLNYYRFREFPTSGQLGYPSVRSIRAAGRYKVVVLLKRRNALWQYTPATYGWIFEKKFADEHKGTMGRPGVLIMGTGPWKFDSLDPTRGLELSANPDYWGGRVPIRRISIKYLSSDQALGLAFRAGEIDFAPDVAAREFEAASGAKVRIRAPENGLAHLIMNTKRAPWNDVHVRRAAAYAINRQELITASGSPGIPITTLLSPLSLRTLGSKAEVARLLKPLPQYRFDLAKARAELARSRYPNGVTVSLPTISALANEAQVIASRLDEIGIRVDLKVVPVGQFIATLNGPRENIDLLYSARACPTMDPACFAQDFVHSKNAVAGKPNRANYTNPSADKLIDRGNELADRAKRLAVYSQLLKILAQDVPYVPLYSWQTAYALSSNFTFPGIHAFTYNTPGWLLGLKRT